MHARIGFNFRFWIFTEHKDRRLGTDPAPPSGHGHGPRIPHQAPVLQNLGLQLPSCHAGPMPYPRWDYWGTSNLHSLLLQVAGQSMSKCALSCTARRPTLNRASPGRCRPPKGGTCLSPLSSESFLSVLAQKATKEPKEIKTPSSTQLKCLRTAARAEGKVSKATLPSPQSWSLSVFPDSLCRPTEMQRVQLSSKPDQL